MRYIKLTQDKRTKIDNEEYDALSKYKWYVAKRGYGFYAQRIIKGRAVQIHRVVMKAKKGEEIDHINGDTLDNRKKNLRIVNRSQNEWNRDKQKNNTSGFKGVSWNKRANKWFASIYKNSQQIYLGLFEDKEEAAKAYNQAATKYHGKFALLNKI